MIPNIKLSNLLIDKILKVIKEYGKSYSFEYDGPDKHDIVFSVYQGIPLMTILYIYECDYALNLKTMKPTKNSRGKGIIPREILDEIMNEIEDEVKIDEFQYNEHCFKQSHETNVTLKYTRVETHVGDVQFLNNPIK